MAQLKLRLRLMVDQEIAFGPGKADLLEAIQATGSISQAAKKMNMSYRRAWQLVETMNQLFTSALVETHKGGESGGGAIVTAFGFDILKQFRYMEQKALAAIEADFQQLSGYLKP
ncbi:winged helix-turn-helix domain-containing protein [Acinetobacter sp. FDAARGOS_515]|uniref:winged helix-turn-helix domain-containing protein n=1 Tax=Acinetobacter sp. FDAARGOS_515 TaxID=2420307 RepID=UPI000F691447|nr:LysR family transcriptional regulator [Acinetobacter sp. FDAARGOS_515]RSC22443.1 LysR family transcriptional regulator [Acinetobacter sp. FDAARGOS_515]